MSTKNQYRLWLRRERYRLKKYHAARGLTEKRKWKKTYEEAHHQRLALQKKLGISHAGYVSANGVKLIAEFEGGQSRDGRFHVYVDVVGVPTIGDGHTEGVTRAGWKGKTSISKAEAETLLLRDLNTKYAPFVAALKLPLNQNQKDALVSFVYNVGPGGIAATTRVGFFLRLRRWRSAADHLLDWNKGGGRVLPGLDRRRHAERTLFLRRVA